jgi:hypothetical protein
MLHMYFTKGKMGPDVCTVVSCKLPRVDIGVYNEHNRFIVP